MTTAEILIAARGLYESCPAHGDPERKGGHCIISALYSVTGNYPAHAENALLTMRQHIPTEQSMVDFEETASTEAVVAAFDAAILDVTT